MCSSEGRWETVTTPIIDEQSENPTLSRRSVIKATGIVAISGTAFTGSATAQQPQELSKKDKKKQRVAKKKAKRKKNKKKKAKKKKDKKDGDNGDDVGSGGPGTPAY